MLSLRTFKADLNENLIITSEFSQYNFLSRRRVVLSFCIAKWIACCGQIYGKKPLGSFSSIPVQHSHHAVLLSTESSAKLRDTYGLFFLMVRL